MDIHKYNKVTIVTADENKHLVIKDNEELAKIERIILKNDGNIPEFEEVEDIAE
jgi:hypothetical protein